MRCIETDYSEFPNHTFHLEARPEMVEDETTEQVFSRKERKAYRAEVLGKRTETKRGNTKRKASTLGEKGSPKAKARRTA